MNTTPSKFKPAPLSTIRYWWGRLRFTRHFEVEVSVPPSAIIAQFYAFDTEPDTHPVLKPQTVSIVPHGRNGDHYTFELEQRRNSMKQGAMMPIYHTVAKAKGIILYSEAYNRTIVRGEIRAGQFLRFG